MIVIALALAGCGGPRGGASAKEGTSLTASGPPLPPPQPIDARVRGAAFLRALAGHIQPRWAQFLEDCRLRLGADDPLNIASLTADLELVLAGDTGKFLEARVTQTSGNSDFDRAAIEILRELPPMPAPAALESDDGLVHVHWVFARDRRQAGPATASVMTVELPLVTTVQRLLDRGALARAAQRLATAKADEPERAAAIELVMIAALREGLASSDGSTREAALEAVTRAKIVALARDVHRLIDANVQDSERTLAIAAAAALGDTRVVAPLLAALELELEDRPGVALAKLAALVALDHAAEAAKAVHAAFALPARKRGVATAVAALAIVPDDKLGKELPRWLERGDAEMRQAVCAALPAAARAQAAALIARGLRDADASVRAGCAQAAARHGARSNAAARLVELARDRDEGVRARAVAALAALKKPIPRTALQDRASRVRAAAATGVAEADLRTLATDKDPDVRAAAVTALVAKLSERAGDLLLAAARDPASQVRRAAALGIADDAVLEKLAGDDDPDVATAALARYAQHRGRAAVTPPFLARLAGSTPRSLERVRVARAWLLAR